MDYPSLYSSYFYIKELDGIISKSPSSKKCEEKLDVLISLLKEHKREAKDSFKELKAIYDKYNHLLEENHIASHVTPTDKAHGENEVGSWEREGNACILRISGISSLAKTTG